MKIKKLILRLIKKAGYSISKEKIYFRGLYVEHDFEVKHKWLIDFGFDTILDIGANTGQFAKKARALFPEAQIYSFEPILDVFQELSSHFATDLKFRALNVGLGAVDEVIPFYQSDFSDSSSAFPMKELHKENFPKAKSATITQIKVVKLDEAVKGLSMGYPLLIKIDVQGYEQMVILGGEQTIRKAAMVLVEVSFYELYENQVLFESIFKDMIRLGFLYKGNYDQLISPIDGRILQADAIFVNENA